MSHNATLPTRHVGDYMGRWDTRMKQLIGIKPQDFVSWLVPDAELINELSEELHGRDLDTDKLY